MSIQELINKSILEATDWQNKLTQKQRCEMTVNQAKHEIVHDISKKLYKDIKNLKNGKK